MPPSDLHVEPVEGPLGVVVEGIDLSEPIESSRIDELRRLLFEHQVLFFRDQPLDDEAHLRFASCFGKPNVYPVNEMIGRHEPLEIVRDGPDRRPTAAGWHTDVTWLPDPPKIGMLNAQVIPESGGDTLWCSLYSLYDALPEAERDALRDRIVHNEPGPVFVELVIKTIDERLVEPFLERYGAGAQHPLIREHDVTGRPLLYLCGGFMDHIIGMERDAGRDLLRRLTEQADDPSHHIRWHWRVGDVALWDERSTMHRVDASHWPEPRRMRRCTVS